MGHQIEYLATVPEAAVRRWLDRLDGGYCSERGDVPFSWEGELLSGGTFWANMTPQACNFSLAMNYSLLYAGRTAAVDFTRRFEEEFWAEFGPLPLVRLDELLFQNWQSAVGRGWEEVPNPVEEVLAWLQSEDSHWDLLLPGQKHG